MSWQQAAFGVLGVLSPIAGLFAAQRLADPEALLGWGLLGVFGLSALLSASLFLGAPSFAAVIAAGALWNPVLVGVASGLGSATGELTGYAAGRGGMVVLGFKDHPWRRDLESQLRRFGFVAILVLAALPLPFFDLAGLIAGSIGYPAHRFWLAAALGKSIRNVGLAWLGFELAGEFG